MIVEAKLVKIVGNGNISRKQSELDEYSRDMSFVDSIRPEYVVRPETPDELFGFIHWLLRLRLCPQVFKK
jgi:FAD/FMN-containing dehydrogenase